MENVKKAVAEFIENDGGNLYAYCEKYNLTIEEVYEAEKLCAKELERVLGVPVIGFF